MKGYKEPRGTNRDGVRRWRLRIHLGIRADGTRATHSETFTGSARDADRRLGVLINRLNTADPDRAGRTFQHLVDEWTRDVAPALADSTRRNYLGNLERHVLPRFADTAVAKITIRELERFYRDLERGGMKPATVHQIHSLVSSLLSTAVRWEWIERNPARATKRTKIEWQPPRVTDETGDQIVRILNVIDEAPMRTAALLTAATGVRRGELCGLRWADLDLDGDHGTVHVARSIDVVPRTREIIVKDTKTHSTRLLQLDVDTIELLRAHWAYAADYALDAGVALDADAYVFSDHPAGTEPWNPSRITWAWRRARKAAGAGNVRFHDLRHYHATALMAATDAATARDRMGHRQLATTNRYAHGTADKSAADAIGAHLRAVGIYR